MLMPVQLSPQRTPRTTEYHGSCSCSSSVPSRIIGLAIGLLKSVYPECVEVEVELAHAGIGLESQVTAHVIYEDIMIPLGFRADIIVENTIILETEAIATVLPTHEARLLAP